MIKMKNIIISLGIAICLAVMSKADKMKTSTTPSDECSMASGAEANRIFAYEMYKVAAKLKPNQNIFLAPTTVGSGLSMMLPGARESTKDQMLEGLMFKNTSTGFEPNDIECLMKMYSNELIETKLEDRGKGTKDVKAAKEDTLQLRTANRLFGEKSFNFSSKFIEQTAKYGVEMTKMNFQTDSAESRNFINQWVEKATEGKIKDLFSGKAIRPDTVLAVVSAIYFKGLWKYPFDPLNTFKQDFKVNDNKTVKADFMTKMINYRMTYSEDLEAQILDVPYDGDAYGKYNASMILIVPTRRGSIERVEEMLSEKTMKPILDELQAEQQYTQRVRLLLPKFKMSKTYQLKPILRRLGIKNLFNPIRANLSGMIDPSEISPNLYVSTAVHKTFIKVDEKGTEAAGASGFGIVPLSLPPRLFCNRPFLFMIYEKNTDGVLFIGKVNDPTVQ
uniref:serpin B9-like n=1 Tax=Styela clava TaxID=7725 RepID=UPI0019397F5B|nr:serpin B9-like [Styela clava]